MGGRGASSKGISARAPGDVLTVGGEAAYQAIATDEDSSTPGENAFQEPRWNMDHEDMELVFEDGFSFIAKGGHSNVGISGAKFDALIAAHGTLKVLTHNHPGGQSFSPDDIDNMTNFPSMTRIVAFGTGPSGQRVRYVIEPTAGSGAIHGRRDESTKGLYVNPATGVTNPKMTPGMYIRKLVQKESLRLIQEIDAGRIPWNHEKRVTAKMYHEAITATAKKYGFQMRVEYVK